MELRGERRDAPVEFLRKWRREVAGAQAGFDMPKAGALVEACHGCGHDRRRVALGKDRVRSFLHDIARDLVEYLRVTVFDRLQTQSMAFFDRN
jgi:hypothetical protein